MLSLKWRSLCLGLNVLRRYKDLEGHFKNKCPSDAMACYRSCSSVFQWGVLQ